MDGVHNGGRSGRRARGPVTVLAVQDSGNNHETGTDLCGQRPDGRLQMTVATTGGADVFCARRFPMMTRRPAGKITRRSSVVRMLVATSAVALTCALGAPAAPSSAAD